MLSAKHGITAPLIYRLLTDIATTPLTPNTMNSEPSYDVFVSYRWDSPDVPWVRNHLYPALNDAGLKVLLDVKDFTPGRHQIIEMDNAIRQSRKTLSILSPSYFDNNNNSVLFEALQARSQDTSGADSKLITLILRTTEVPGWMRTFIPLDWTNPANIENEWNKLLKALGATKKSQAPIHFSKLDASHPVGTSERDKSKPLDPLDFPQTGHLEQPEPVPILAQQAKPFVEQFILQSGFVPPHWKHPTNVSRFRDQLIDAAMKAGIYSLDYFILRLVARNQISGMKQSSGLSDLIYFHIWEQLGKDQKKLDIAIEFAFQSLSGECSTLVDTKIKDLIRDHSLIRDYLIARYVVTCYSLIGNSKSVSEKRKYTQKINVVYQYDVNTFIKGILNYREERDPRYLVGILKAIQFILSDTKLSLLKIRAHACYVAGRLKQDQVATQAVKLLKEQLAKWDDKLEDQLEKLQPEELLIVRGMYISLGYLNSFDSLSRYVHILLHSPRMDALNRGFHLEYYKDQTFILNSPLTSSDKLGQCPNTFAVLLDHLSQPNHPLRILDAHTLASLAQHRLEVGGLSNENERIILADALDRVLRTPIAVGSHARRLPEYLSMVSKHLRKFDFRPVTAMYEFWKLKRVPRTGWVKRKALHVESVTTHTMGAMLLALLFLPNKHGSSGTAYSKSRIIELLFTHDLAEAEIGDIPESEKSSDHHRIELTCMKELSFMGSYSQALGGGNHDVESPDLRQIAVDFEEFQLGSTINSQIANELDKLDCLLEGLTLLAQNEFEGDEVNYYDIVRTSKEAVSTELGQHVLRKILTMDVRFPKIVERVDALTPHHSGN